MIGLQRKVPCGCGSPGLAGSVPVPFLHHSTTPSFPYAIAREISCNPWPPFPLYGVEAGTLPAKAAQQKEANVDKDNQTSEVRVSDKCRKKRAASAAGLPHEVLDRLKKTVWGVRRVRRPGNPQPPKPRKPEER